LEWRQQAHQIPPNKSNHSLASKSTQAGPKTIAVSMTPEAQNQHTA